MQRRESAVEAAAEAVRRAAQRKPAKPKKDATYYRSGTSDPYRQIFREQGRKVIQVWTVFVDGKLHSFRKRRDALALVRKAHPAKHGERQLPKLQSLVTLP